MINRLITVLLISVLMTSDTAEAKSKMAQVHADSNLVQTQAGRARYGGGFRSMGRTMRRTTHIRRYGGSGGSYLRFGGYGYYNYYIGGGGFWYSGGDWATGVASFILICCIVFCYFGCRSIDGEESEEFIEETITVEEGPSEQQPGYNARNQEVSYPPNY